MKYYPPWYANLVLPLIVAMILSRVPIPGKWVMEAFVYIIVFFACRQLLCVQVNDGVVSGRHPRNFKQTSMPLESITGVTEMRSPIGGVKGWSFADNKGNEVFVNGPAAEDPGVASTLRKVHHDHRS